MTTRDIPFDEECPERSDTYREAFGEPCSLADLEAARLRWRALLDRPSKAQRIGAEMHAIIADRLEHGASLKQAHKDARNHQRFGTR